MAHTFQPKLDDPLNVYLAALLASESYGDLATFGNRLSNLGTSLARVGEFEEKATFAPVRTFDTQGVVAADDDSVVLAFRGTEPTQWADDLTDATAVLVTATGYPGKVHWGFKDAYEGVAAKIETLLTPHKGKNL